MLHFTEGPKIHLTRLVTVLHIIFLEVTVSYTIGYYSTHNFCILTPTGYCSELLNSEISPLNI